MVGLAAAAGACAEASTEGTTPVTEPASTVTLAAPGATTAAAPPPSQSPVDAARDGIVPEIAALPLEQRVNEIRPSYDFSRMETDVGRIETAEGAWVISTPSPGEIPRPSEIGDAAGAYGKDYVDLGEYAEILLLDPETGEIVKAFPFPTFTPRSLGLFGDDLYCIGYLVLCRIDRRTLQAAVRIFAEDPEIDPDDYAWLPDNWTLDVRGWAPLALEGSGASPDGIDPRTLEAYSELWTRAEAERHVENFLAALAAGAYEQAALSAEGLDTAADRLRSDESGAGRRSDETTAEYLARMCDGGRCAGPYEVEADGPGYGRSFGQAGSTVTVVHTESGETGAIRLGDREGRITVMGLPPLVESDGGPTLVDLLFGRGIPQNVVVQRYGAFEVWESGRREWVTNRYADDARQVERTIVAVSDLFAPEDFAVKLRDDSIRYSMGCGGRLATRGVEVLALDGKCGEGDLFAAEVISGEARDLPAAPDLKAETLSVWYDERGGTAIQGDGDHEFLSELTTLDGTDLLGDDYAGLARLSVDGKRLAYADLSRAGSLPMGRYLVVVDTKSGEVVGRWTLGGVITCLELAEDWVVACEAKDDRYMPEQEALVAINTATGEINRVKTRVRIFLP